MQLSSLYQPASTDTYGRKISQDLYTAIQVNSDFDQSCMYITTHSKVRNAISAVSNNVQAFAFNFYPQQFDAQINGWCFGRKTNGAVNYYMDMTFGQGGFARPKFGNSGNTTVAIVSDININEYALRGISMYCYDRDNIGTDLRPVGLGNKDFEYLLENPNKLCRIGTLGLMYNFANHANNNLQPTIMINGKITGFVSPYSLFCTNSKYGAQCNYQTGVQNGGWSDSDTNYANDSAWVNYDTTDKFLEAVPKGLTYNIQDGRLETGDIVFENDVCVAYYRKDFTFRCDAIEWYYKVSWVLELIASMGVYVQKTNTAYDSLDDLIGSGNCYLGEMTSAGVSTGRFLHTQTEIEAAYNYNINTNNSPVIPPGHDVDDRDNIATIDFGLYFQQSGLVKYYACTSQKLSDFSDALGDEQIIPANKNVLPNLISLKAFPMAKSVITHGFEEDVEIAGINTNVEMTRIDNTMYNMRAGVVTINGKFGSVSNKHFLDYAPYTQVEIILPFIGPVQLDTNMVMYRQIQIYYTIDIYVGTIKATILADNNIVGTGVGNCSFDIPFTADNVGAKWADGLSAWQEVALNGFYGAGAIVERNYGAAISDYAKAIFSIQNASLAANKNYTQVIGHCTDTNNFTIHKPVVKISRPIADEITGYKKEVGLVLQKYRKLGTLAGYTTCSNPILNVPNATNNEVTMIKQKLIEGVIL